MPQLKGALRFSTVPQLMAQSAKLAAGPLDLSQVDAVDSAGVAFLLALRRQAAEQGQALALHHAAPQLVTLLRFYGVDTMFELDNHS